ncbi:NAD(P)/FAD-dependent oxidoreductase [Streptomyces sp. MST-110588]|uniref:NAD(P)/FAD-dependent oxidoreductase n=1 Tax=Streptomyces sp. MST-110588 TaxID=2833628 RepID=UPI001F5CEA14|nr:NAD(P)/FAD-dependent oxidoreductase [Streptomyces sp. MST-110588]UNO44348.1 NAD(P)/FAD-dependent oxidoreductase [Streptomyces sp. MST-110588]
MIVGAGFAGYQCARTLSRTARGAAEIVLVNPHDYFLYLPLLPEVAAGVLEPRRVSVSLTGTLPHVRLVLGEVGDVDLDERRLTYTDPEGRTGTLGYDRLVLTVGSVNKLLPVPGVAEHAHGFRGMPEALYLRDHVTRQIELAGSTEDDAERAARTTFVVVGAGYTGTEVTAHGVLFTDALARQNAGLRGAGKPRWMLLDLADRILPELDPRLSRAAHQVLSRRGVDVRTGTSVKEATSDGVLLDDGSFVATRSLIWCVGVRPDPLVASLGLPIERGRLCVDKYLRVPGHPEVLACGDAAAVPDLTRPGEFTPMTAQHAQRQGRVAAHNIAASYGKGEIRPYKHNDLGFMVDLGGIQAAANPLHLPLSGPFANLVTRGYHLMAMPGNRVRVAADWTLEALLPRQGVQLGLVRSGSVPLDAATPELARVPAGPGREDGSGQGNGRPQTGESHGPGGTA